jgi:N-acetylmuramoyl-L-alanine amidase
MAAATMIHSMNYVSRRDHLSSTYSLIFFVFSVLALAQFLYAERWDAQGAQQAFQEANEKRDQLGQTAKPSPSQYLDCARSYRKVYTKNPHFPRAGEAILEEAAVYQEMGDKFGDIEYYKTAVKRLLLLVKQYDGNPNCPNALERLILIYSKQLKDENAAQNYYKILKSEYKNSKAAQRVSRIETAAEIPQPSPPPKKEETPRPIEPENRSTSLVQNVRFWTTNEYTRVSIDMDIDASFEKFQISEPERIYLDISKSRVGKDFQDRTLAVGDGILKQIRIAQNRTDLVRVVLDCSIIVDYSVSELHNPYRIVVDIRRRSSGSRDAIKADKKAVETKSEAFSAEAAAPAAKKSQSGQPILKEIPAASSVHSTNAETQKPEPLSKPQTAHIEKTSKPPLAITPDTPLTPKPASPTSQGDRTLTRILGLKVNRIVLDPGHGGHDQGTIGPGGLLEKNLVLSIALGLEKMLREKLGADVILTRTDDSFIPLEERTSIANKHHADLFVSIHANSSRIKSISGVETYYLSFAQTDAEREIAARENATTESKVADLEDLIKKIAQADKSAESRELASSVQKKLFSGAKKLFSNAANRGVRSAPFIVLIGANMPSVLAEIAFISSILLKPSIPA